MPIARLHGFVLTIGTREGGGCDVAMWYPALEGTDAERPGSRAPAPILQMAEGC